AMEKWAPETYGERIADVYEDLHAPLLNVDATVQFLAELAQGGPALELAVGTGRIALPLSERGIDVHGIDASRRMVERLRDKPGGDRVEVTFGDFADVDVDGRYSLIFLVFNTLFALTDQRDQVRCFRNVAEHLTPEGVFVVEAFVPDLARFDRGQRVQVNEIELDRVVIDVNKHDAPAQIIDAQHIVIANGELKMYPVKLRYAWPAEMDLMAELAGMRLRDRWSGWSRDPFTAASQSHVSVYELNS
ncbi:MAG TPA: class I SAM-dependent methyltransferase, partial [Actinomycetota bacterium]|nr:class I SAM-dependent methyltransferase [Actinomycetota bacterium]